jgi:hypothetical protein
MMPPESPTWSLLLRVMSAAVIGWELAAIAVPFLPVTGVCIFLSIGVLFHMGIAVIMGLNDFLWPFLSTYPAILLLNFELSRLAG